MATIVTQGACWLAAKIETGTELHKRAVTARVAGQIVTAILVVAVSVMFFTFIGFPQGEGPAFPFLVFVACILVAAIVVGFLAAGRGKNWLAFGANSAVCVALVFALVLAMFPNLVVSTGPGPSIDLFTAAASTYGLTVMTIIACIGVPLVAIYHVIIYRTFRGTIKVEED